MSEHQSTLAWRRATPDFAYETYDRNHEVTLGNGTSLTLSAAAAFRGDPRQSNPEEVFVAALSSCHMLTFLAICARAGLVVDSYDDDASGLLGKRKDGVMAMTEVTLRPLVVFGGDRQPGADEVVALHDKAHHGCFIANSVACSVTVAPRA